MRIHAEFLYARASAAEDVSSTQGIKHAGRTIRTVALTTNTGGCSASRVVYAQNADAAITGRNTLYTIGYTCILRRLPTTPVPWSPADTPQTPWPDPAEA